MSEKTDRPGNPGDIFAMADANKDGAISKEEFEAVHPPKPPYGMPPDFSTYQSDAQELSSTGEAGALLDLLSQDRSPPNTIMQNDLHSHSAFFYFFMNTIRPFECLGCHTNNKMPLATRGIYKWL